MTASKYMFVINSFLAGGAERSLLDLLPALIEGDVIPIVVALRVSDIGFEDELHRAGYDFRVLPPGNRMMQAHALRRLVKREAPDLVYTSLFDADIAGRLACIGLRVPVVSNLANTSYDQARFSDPGVDRMKLRVVRMIDGFTARHLTDHFHAVSQAAKDSAVATLGLEPDRVTVVRRGRDPNVTGAASLSRRMVSRDRLGVDQEAELVVSVGRQEYQKGHIHLIDAFAGIGAARPSARLLIVGREGHATTSLKARIEALGLAGIVSLLGHREDVPEILAAADLFAFPSLYEGLGGALIEAMALSLPIVASDLSAIREVVHPGENATLVPVADAAALREAIVTLLQDSDRRRSYAERSRKLFERRFRLEDDNRDLMELLARVAR